MQSSQVPAVDRGEKAPAKGVDVNKRAKHFMAAHVSQVVESMTE